MSPNLCSSVRNFQVFLRCTACQYTTHVRNCHSFIKPIPPTSTVLWEAMFPCWLTGSVPEFFLVNINIAEVSWWREKAISKLSIYVKSQFSSHIQTHFKNNSLKEKGEETSVSYGVSKLTALFLLLCFTFFSKCLICIFMKGFLSYSDRTKERTYVIESNINRRFKDSWY